MIIILFVLECNFCAHCNFLCALIT